LPDPSGPSSDANRRHLYGLDGVRVAAALLVILYHLAIQQAPSGDRAAALPTILLPIARSGWVGVQIFFVLSGFVIAESAIGRSRRAFLQSRFIRLYPAILICASLTTAVALAAGDRLPGQGLSLFVRTVLLVPFDPWVDSPYWSLFVELCFYGVVGACLSPLGPRRMNLVIYGIGLASAAFWLAWLGARTGLIAGSAAAALSMLSTLWLAMLLLLQHGCFFALGAGIRHIRRSQATASSIVVTILCGLACLIQIYVSASWSSMTDVWHWPATIFACGVAGVVLADVFAPRPRGRAATIVKTAGLMTYPLYLLHSKIGDIMITTMLRDGVPVAVALAMAIAAVFAIALAVTHWLERPIRRGLAKSLTQMPAGGSGGSMGAASPMQAGTP